jgi:hypothetical protein
MSKHSQHITIEEQQETREKGSLAQERIVILVEFHCERNNEPICERVAYQLRDTL